MKETQPSYSKLLFSVNYWYH